MDKAILDKFCQLMMTMPPPARMHVLHSLAAAHMENQPGSILLLNEVDGSEALSHSIKSMLCKMEPTEGMTWCLTHSIWLLTIVKTAIDSAEWTSAASEFPEVNELNHKAYIDAALENASNAFNELKSIFEGDSNE